MTLRVALLENLFAQARPVPVRNGSVRALALNRKTETPPALLPGQIRCPQIRGEPLTDAHLVEAFVAAEIVAFEFLDGIGYRVIAKDTSRSPAHALSVLFCRPCFRPLTLVLTRVHFVSFPCYRRDETVLLRGIVLRGTERRSFPIPGKCRSFSLPSR